MSESNKTSTAAEQEQTGIYLDYEQGVKNPKLINRRFVGTREKVGYLLNDAAASFNISKYNDRFIYDIVNLDFDFLAVFGLFSGLWDTINDTFIGVIVDRTRTRWGKFKPYILLGKIPLAILGLWYWFMPMLFAGTAGTYLPKLVFYAVFSVICETAGTFTAVANTGFMATITPNPLERTGLITMANLLSGFVGEKLPELTFGVLLDLVNNNVVSWDRTKLFMGFGIGTAIISCIMSFYFICVTKERVLQSIEKPSIIQGLKAIINNRPILLYTLSEFLAGFAVGKSRTNYYIDVLGSATYQTIVGIPASPVSSISYAFIAPLRKKFATKTIWILEDLWTDTCWLAVFAIGSIGGMKNGLYKNKWVMLPVMAVEEVFEMCVYGLRHVIPQEILNEAMDYCEWKNGYRAEAMTGVARGLVTKLQGIVMGSIQNFIMKRIGYVQGLTIGTQADSTKWWIFAMGTGIPVITGALGVIPKFFHDLNGEKRDRMYRELYARREATQNAVANAKSSEEVKNIARAQINAEYIQEKKTEE
ncbi:MAG: MFS transporter [Clostridia bacterium]|nr:MFS transporter [Clostridia bacterium]